MSTVARRSPISATAEHLCQLASHGGYFIQQWEWRWWLFWTQLTRPGSAVAYDVTLRHVCRPIWTVSWVVYVKLPTFTLLSERCSSCVNTRSSTAQRLLLANWQPATRRPPLPTITDGHRQPYDLNSSTTWNAANSIQWQIRVGSGEFCLTVRRAAWTIESTFRNIGRRSRSSAGPVDVSHEVELLPTTVVIGDDLHQKKKHSFLYEER